MPEHSVAKSMQLFQQAMRIIPGGTQLVSRRPTRFAYGTSPIYAERAQGARFWDVDGNEYIDWVSGVGAIILGYADEVVDRAVWNQIQQGTITSINHRLEIDLAEELIRRVPCAEMVRYAKGGGEACAMAVRIARGATGRDRILFCGYHGWHDWYLAANLGSEDLQEHLFPGIEPVGVPRNLQGTALPFPYGDLDALEQQLIRYPDQVAAIIMEPMRTEAPPDGYLAEVARMARDFGTLLIFDEVSTGFRPSAGGIQELVGVTPDMAVFAKSISNGYPMAAVVGSKAFLEPASRMFISSTYWSDTIGLQAALTTLREVQQRQVPRQLLQLGTALMDGINEAAQDVGVPVQCHGLAFHPRMTFHVDAPLQPKLATLFIQEMARRGCHGYTSFYLNAAQGAGELEQTFQAARETFHLIRKVLDGTRTLEDLLHSDPPAESFRRLVR